MHTLNGKSYIGQTCQEVSDRTGTHFQGYKASPAFYNAIQKHGTENIKTEILYKCQTVEEANRLESLTIFRYNTLSPNGYNLHTGGLNHTVSEISRQKMSQSRKGLKRSAKVRKEMSERLKGEKHHFYGKKLSPEHRKNISKNSARFWQGKNLSKETREKLRQINLGKKHTPETIQHLRETATRYWTGKKIPKEIIRKRSETRIRKNAEKRGQILIDFSK